MNNNNTLFAKQVNYDFGHQRFDLSSNGIKTQFKTLF